MILRISNLQKNRFAWNVGDIYIERKGVLQLSPKAILKLEAKDQRIRARTNNVQNDNNLLDDLRYDALQLNFCSFPSKMILNMTAN